MIKICYNHTLFDYQRFFMNNIIKISLLFILILTGCGGPRYKKLGPVYSEKVVLDKLNQSKNMALLVIYKYGVNATNFYAGRNVEILIDKVNVGDLDEKTYIVKEVTPGEHEINAIVPFMQRPTNAMIKFGKKTIQQNFQANTVYYINYNIDAEPIGKQFNYYGVAQGTHEAIQKTNKVTFSVMDKERALSQLSYCKEMLEFD